MDGDVMAIARNAQWQLFARRQYMVSGWSSKKFHSQLWLSL